MNLFDIIIARKLSGGGGGGDTGEVWLVTDSYHDSGEVREFALSNVGEENHFVELGTNGENYQVFLNGEELPYFSRPSENTVLWLDSDTYETTTKGLNIQYQGADEAWGAATYVGISTAPTSVEVSVKAK